jgi:hypothetical protein
VNNLATFVLGKCDLERAFNANEGFVIVYRGQIARILYSSIRRYMPSVPAL